MDKKDGRLIDILTSPNKALKDPNNKISRIKTGGF